MTPFLKDLCGVAVPTRVEVSPTGEFSYDVPCTEPDGLFGQIRIEAWPDDDTWPVYQDVPNAQFLVHGSQVTPVGGMDGLPRLEAPAQRTGLASETDEQLAALWARWLQGYDDLVEVTEASEVDAAFARDVDSYAGFDLDATHPSWDRLPLELLRRGGTRWTELLARGSRYGDGSLHVLTASRRRQGQRDPLAIEILPESSTVVEFPDMPSLRVRRTNVDVGRENLDVSSDVHRRWRIDTRTTQGIPTFTSYRWLCGRTGAQPVVADARLQFGEHRDETVEVRTWCNPLPLGHTALRLLLTDSGEAWGLFDPERALVLFHSEPVQVEVRPRRVTVSRDRRRELEDALRAIDTSGRLPVTDERLAWIDRWQPDPRSPEEIVLSGGMAAVGVLLSQLDAPDQAPRQRMFVFALLYSLTGMFGQEPMTDGPGILGLGSPTIETRRDEHGLVRLSWLPRAPDAPLEEIREELVPILHAAWTPYRHAVVLREP